MVNDEPPEEEEVKEAVRKLNVGKAARAMRIVAEHIKVWMNGTEDKESPGEMWFLLGCVCGCWSRAYPWREGGPAREGLCSVI
jgi:hypothetical protein